MILGDLIYGILAENGIDIICAKMIDHVPLLPPQREEIVERYAKKLTGRNDRIE